jgi:hypothetical protein
VVLPTSIKANSFALNGSGSPNPVGKAMQADRTAAKEKEIKHRVMLFITSTSEEGISTSKSLRMGAIAQDCMINI